MVARDISAVKRDRSTAMDMNDETNRCAQRRSATRWMTAGGLLSALGTCLACCSLPAVLIGLGATGAGVGAVCSQSPNHEAGRCCHSRGGRGYHPMARWTRSQGQVLPLAVLYGSAVLWFTGNEVTRMLRTAFALCAWPHCGYTHSSVTFIWAHAPARTASPSRCQARARLCALPQVPRAASRRHRAVRERASRNP